MTDAASAPADARLRRGIHPGLRARIAISVALVTLLASVAVSITTLTVNIIDDDGPLFADGFE